MQEGLFHLSVKMVQRSKGRSATAAIAYRAGIDITDERTGERFDYTRKTGVSYSEIVLPKGAPEEFRDRKKLWNAVEQAETRKNSAVAREFEVALPHDLPRHVREQLVSNIVEYIVDRFEVAADANCHDPHPRKTDDEDARKNYHVHILTSTRKLTADGFTDKVRELDSAKTGSALVEEVREFWANSVNEAYAKYGVDKFVDHRSFERRGIEAEPQIHVGVNQTGERAEQNAAIIAAREHIAQMERETAAIQLQIQNLLVEQTPPGETIPLFALEPATTEEPRFPIETAPQPAQPDPRQLEIDFSEPAPVVVTHHEKPEPQQPENVIQLDKIRRFNELVELKKNAGTYGRALENIREQRGLAASFQRELDALERPSFVHRFMGTKKWQTYEGDYEKLSQAIRVAEHRAKGLQAVAKQYKSFQTQWDKQGYFEYQTLSKELDRLGPQPPHLEPTPVSNAPDSQPVFHTHSGPSF